MNRTTTRRPQAAAPAPTSATTTTNGLPAPARAGGRGGALPCRTADPALWFAELPADVERAKELCVPCPLRASCLAGALERAEPWGVWGGELLERGVVVPRKRPRGRPRKDAAAA